MAKLPKKNAETRSYNLLNPKPYRKSTGMRKKVAEICHVHAERGRIFGCLRYDLVGSQLGLPRI